MKISHAAPTWAAGEGAPAFPINHTVLLVIDPVNDFLSEGGAAWELTKTTVTINNVVNNLRRAIEGAREHGIPVLFGPMAYTEEDYADHALHRRTGINRMMFEKKMFLAGSWGADFHPDLRPREDEVVLLPHKGTDVFETDLPGYLEHLGTTHLAIAGMTANLCCESTGRHAAERGYDVTYLSDAIGADNMLAYEASIHINYPLIGNAVMTVDKFFMAMDASGAAREAAQPGDSVRGSDDGEIGTVERVIGATDEAEASLLVPRGLIFTSDTYIPLNAVVRRAGAEVYINLPKILVGKMPWDRPPSRLERRSLFGPRAGEVKKLYGSRAPSVAEGPEFTSG